MNIQTVRKALLWCTVINYGMLIVWFLSFWIGHDSMYDLNRIWFRVTIEEFDAVNFGGILLYKVGIILFNLVPCIALYIV